MGNTMKQDTKISKLKQALIAGEELTPLDAWKRWGMAQNTFNRQIWELKRRHRLNIVSRKIKCGDSQFCSQKVVKE